MKDFPQLAQSLSVALKALQMYTAAHPRAQESLTAAHAILEQWLADQDRLQFVVSRSKAFVDCQVQDTHSPHVAALVKRVSERGVRGFVFERGLSADELLAFLQGLTTKPARLEEQGGFEALLTQAGVARIRISQTRYQEVGEGVATAPEDQAPSLATASPSASPDALLTFIREALLATLAKNSGGFPAYKADESGEPPNLLRGFRPADLSGLGPLGLKLGLGDSMPTPVQLGTLRHVLLGLSPEVQLGLLAGLSSLPEQPPGLALGVKALAGELLAVATGSALTQGASWFQLQGPLLEILRPLPDREFLVRTLAEHLRAGGQDAAPSEAILRHLQWEALSLEAKLLKVLQEGYLAALSLEERLALLRELLDLRRFDDFLHLQELLIPDLRSEHPERRLMAAQTLAGVARWAHHPGLPPGGEGPLAEALRAHFAWEPEPPLHRWSAEGLEGLLAALVLRHELRPALSDLQALEGLCGFLEEQHPWRLEALARLRTSLLRPQLLDAALARAFELEREQMFQEVQPYLECLGEPMARHLLSRLEEESDRTRRGRLVEALRGLGATSLPTLLEALTSPAWYLVRNALTLLPDLGDAGCVPAILPLLRHPEPRVRRTAVRALWKLGGPAAEPHLLAQIRDSDAETLQEILFALGMLRSEGSLPQVAELAQDKRVRERLRIQALETLGQIASPQALPVLRECLRRKTFFGGGESPAIRLAAAKALNALGTPEARTILQKAIEAEPKGEERESFFRLLDLPAQP